MEILIDTWIIVLKYLTWLKVLKLFSTTDRGQGVNGYIHT